MKINAHNNLNDEILFSIVVPLYNEEKYIGSCLEHAKNQQGDFNYDIIAVDNGSTDMSNQIVRSKGASLVKEDKRGVGSARKKGAEVAQGKYIVQIDADTNLPCDFLQQALKRFEEDENLACLGGQFYFYDGSILKNAACVVFFRPILFFAKIASFNKVGPIGNGMVFKKELYDKTRGFDENLKFGEDADLTRRLSEFGKIKVDCSLRYFVSSRRFKLNIKLAVLAWNFVKMCFGRQTNYLPPRTNEL
ncbi:MAG: glycosyltransferase [bacterium]